MELLKNKNKNKDKKNLFDYSFNKFLKRLESKTSFINYEKSLTNVLVTPIN